MIRTCALGVVVFAACALAQPGSFRSISGVISQPNGQPVPHIPVQIKDSRTGSTYSASGRRGLTNSPFQPSDSRSTGSRRKT